MRGSVDRCVLVLVLAWAVGLAACDDGGGDPCLLDSDCPSFGEICAAGRCRAPGTITDGGPREDAGARDAGRGMDAGPRDAGEPETDAGETDAGGTDAAAEDAAGTDAGDAAAAACPDPSGTWAISAVTGTCGSATAGQGLTIAGVLTPCSFTAASPVVGAPTLDGTFALDATGNLTGVLSAGGGAAGDCSGALLTPTTLSVSCVAGPCTLDFTR